MGTTRRRSFTIQPRGPFSLQELATFGFGQREAAVYDGVMRLAFCVDGYVEHAGVVVRQGEPDGPITCDLHGDADLGVVQRQVARVLSLDGDGVAFQALGERDPVLAELLAAAPGLRPPLFYSAYEAAAWVILSTRRARLQAARLRDRLNHAHGVGFDLDGTTLFALPSPQQLLGVREFDGLQLEQITRLHGVAHAALEGRLDTGRLAALDPAVAMQELQTIRGIGPFYSSLVVIRALGLTDVLPHNEPLVLSAAARLYGVPEPMSQQEFERRAEQWRPFRTWATVLIRAAGTRVLRERGSGTTISPSPGSEHVPTDAGPAREFSLAEAWKGDGLSVTDAAEGDLLKGFGEA